MAFIALVGVGFIMRQPKTLPSEMPRDPFIRNLVNSIDNNRRTPKSTTQIDSLLFKDSAGVYFILDLNSTSTWPAHVYLANIDAETFAPVGQLVTVASTSVNVRISTLGYYADKDNVYLLQIQQDTPINKLFLDVIEKADPLSFAVLEDILRTKDTYHSFLTEWVTVDDVSKYYVTTL